MSTYHANNRRGGRKWAIRKWRTKKCEFRGANAGNANFSRGFESIRMNDVEEWRKGSLYKYLYKPLFVTLIVNKKENIVCITSVFRDAGVWNIAAPLIPARPPNRTASFCLPSLFFLPVRFLSFNHLRSGWRDEFTHGCRRPHCTFFTLP